MKYLITGTGRCGTGYAARLLTSAGVKCSHEGVFTPAGWEQAKERIGLRRQHPDWGWEGESSWLAVPFVGKPELEGVTIVHLARHPKAVMDSFLRLMLYTRSGSYYRWMAQFIPRIEEFKSSVEKAAYWYVTLNEMVEPHAHVFHRVEDGGPALLDKLGIAHGGKELFSNTRYNTRTGHGPSDVALGDISQPWRAELQAMAQRYGYEWETWGPQTVMASWFDGQEVEICRNSANLGGSWQLRDKHGKPLCYDAPLVRFFFSQAKTVEHPLVVDVGASTGNFALLPLLHPGMEVEAFEPNPLACRSLKTNVKLHGLGGRVRVHQMALSDWRGRGVLQVPTSAVHAAVACLSPGTPRKRGFEWKNVDVEVRRLDDFNWAPNFLKIDVEGAELLVLKGGERTIRRHKPKILIEYTSLNTHQFGYDPAVVLDLLKGWGYTRFKTVGLEDLWAEPS